MTTTSDTRPPAAVPTREELEAMRARCEAATPGPWVTRKYSFDGGGGIRQAEWTPCGTPEHDDCYVAQAVYVESAASPEVAVVAYHGWERVRRDAAFIARAREDMPRLLAAVEALEAERDALREIERAAREYVAALADSVPTTARRIDRIKSGHAALARALAATGEGVDAGG